MAKITQIIQPQMYELIRDRIASILAIELANQVALGGYALCNSVVWVERTVPFDKTELPAINVYYRSSNYADQTPITSKGDNIYKIDVYTSSKHKDGIDGDKLSSIKCQRLLGIIRAILESPHYIRLDFSSYIAHTNVSEISIGEAKDQDTTQIVAGQLTLSVTATETVEQIQPSELNEYLTYVTLGETDKGYFYKQIKN